MLAILLVLRSMLHRKGESTMSEKPAVLNPATAWSIQQAESREEALKVLHGLSNYVDSRERMRDCLQSGQPFKGASREERYFRYLLAAQQLINELYPQEPRS